MDGRTGSNLDQAGLEIEAVLVNNCDSCVKDQQFLEIRILVQKKVNLPALSLASAESVDGAR